MSRSNYNDDYDDNWSLIRWRGAVRAAIRGRRGQAFLKDMLNAFDAMTEKRLIKHELEADGEHCALGVVGKAKGLPIQDLDLNEPDDVADCFGIAQALAREIVYENDEGDWSSNETPEQRWRRMRAWAASQVSP